MNQLPGEERKCKALVIGIGSPLRRDDAAALYLARELMGKGYKCVIECPMGIELCAHHINKLRPHLLIIVDAGLGVKPGEIMVLDKPPSLGLSLTHNIDPKLVHRYISSYADNILYILLGVRDVGIGEGLSREAYEAVQKAIDIISRVIGDEA